MRQAGLKPKGRSSGIHQMRLAANNKRKKAEKSFHFDILSMTFVLFLAPFLLIAMLIDAFNNWRKKTRA